VGTTFKIYLPWHMAEARLSERVLPPVAWLTGTETILLVEDEEIVRGLARSILEAGGYKVLEAARGAEALQICEESSEQIHLLLTDVVLPQMSGPELALALAEVHPEIPVIYMSGYTDDAIVHHGVLNPGTNFVEKPFSPEGLLRKIRQILDAQRWLPAPAPFGVPHLNTIA
jgi:CheY-like chemotaxis protein